MKKPGIIGRFFSFLLRVIVVAALMVIIAVGSFEGVTYYLTGSLYDPRDIWKDNTITADDSGLVQEEAELDDKNTKSTLFFVEGNDGLSRYTSLIMMNNSTKAVNILLIPMHAQVTVGGKLLTDIQKNVSGVASTVELDDIARAYGEDRYDIISEIYEQILGVTISGYDVMTQEKFERLLDIAGTVPYHFTDLISYRDGRQVLNYIDVGDQELDGRMAMVLMGYLDGSDKQESDRLEKSNTYLETWIERILRTGKGAEVVSQVRKEAVPSKDRDYTEEEKIWDGLSAEAVTLRILQGAEESGVFVIDSQKAKLQLTTLLKQSAEYSSSGDQDGVDSYGDEYGTTESSKDYFIELYNAAFQQGLASQWEGFLEGEGYNISLISNYQEEGPISTTRIIVNREGIGQDLLKYFPGAYIQTGEIDTGGDIQVYIGTDSINVGVSDGSVGSDASDVYDTEDSDAAEPEYGYDGDAGTDGDDSVSRDESSAVESETGSGYYNFETDTE